MSVLPVAQVNGGCPAGGECAAMTDTWRRYGPLHAAVPEPEPVRIAHTPPRYAPHLGGVEAVDRVLAEYSRSHGDEVVVLCADTPRGAPAQVGGVPVVRLPWRRSVANTPLTHSLPLALWRERWDVVHTHLPTPWSADVSVLVARLRGRRSVVHFHNPIVGDGRAGAVARLYSRTVQRVTLGLSDAVVVISPSRRALLLAEQPGLAAKVHLVPNGVDLERFRPPPAGARGTDLLFVSVLDDFHDYKGLSVLLAALATVPEVTLRVVGDGPGRQRWAHEAAALGLADRVVWEGAVADDALRELYRGCGVFVLPSRTADHEGGSSLVALEAMASGLPVVLADGVGDLAAEAAAAGAGEHVRSGDVPQLAAALTRLVTDADRRARLGAAARRHVELHHNWDEACAAITRLYRR